MKFENLHNFFVLLFILDLIDHLNSISCNKVLVREAESKRKLDCGVLVSTQNIPVKQTPNNSSQSNCGECNQFVLKSGHKRKRDHDNLLFASMNIRPLHIVLDRIDISKIRTNEKLKTNRNNVTKVISENCMIGEKPAQPQNKCMFLADTKKDPIDEKRESNEVTSVPSTRKQPSRKAKVVSVLSEETKSSRSVNRKTGAKNKLVPFKNTKKAEEFVPGQIVLAHVTGYCDWPAFIKSIHGEILVVEFFGTGQV